MMDPTILRDNIVGWGVMALGLKQGVTVAESLELIREDCKSPGVPAAFASTIDKVAELQGQEPPPDFNSQWVPPSALVLCWVGWLTGLLEQTCAMASDLLRQRRRYENGGPDARADLFGLYFFSMLQVGTPVIRALRVIQQEFSWPEWQRPLHNALDALDQGKSLTAAFAPHAALFTPGILAQVQQLEEGGDLDAILAAHRKTRFQSEAAVDPERLKLYEAQADKLMQQPDFEAALGSSSLSLRARIFLRAGFCTGQLPEAISALVQADQLELQVDNLFNQN